jgi:hypothetical protein
VPAPAAGTAVLAGLQRRKTRVLRRRRSEKRAQGTKRTRAPGPHAFPPPSAARTLTPPFHSPLLPSLSTPAPPLPLPLPLSPRPVVWARNGPRSFAPSRSLPPGCSRLPPVGSGRLGTAAPSVGPRGEPRPPRPGRPSCPCPAGRRLFAPPGRGACPRGPGGASC